MWSLFPNKGIWSFTVSKGIHRNQVSFFILILLQVEKRGEELQKKLRIKLEPALSLPLWTFLCQGKDSEEETCPNSQAAHFIHTLLTRSQIGLVVFLTGITGKGSTGESREKIICPFCQLLLLQEKKKYRQYWRRAGGGRKPKGQSVRMIVFQECANLRKQREKSLKHDTPPSPLSTGALLKLLNLKKKKIKKQQQQTEDTYKNIWPPSGSPQMSTGRGNQLLVLHPPKCPHQTSMQCEDGTKMRGKEHHASITWSMKNLLSL